MHNGSLYETQYACILCSLQVQIVNGPRYARTNITNSLEETMKRFRLIALFAAMAMTLAVSAVAAPAGTMVPKISSFDVLVDYSGSMMMKNNSGSMLTKNQTKMGLAKAAMQRMNDRIPALNYSGAMHTFAPVSEVLPLAPYNKASLDKGIKALKSEMDIYGRMTPMGDGVQALASTYNKMPRKAAVIMVTDGANNLGSDPVAQVNALYAANPDICVHVISLADDKQGAEVIKKIASLRKCSIVVEAADMVSSDAVADKFVRDVFYDVVGGGTIALRSVQFAFNSAVVDGPSAAILDEVASMLKKDPRKIQIDGYTCNIGSAAYNMGLSERRADSVKAYLVKKGIPASSITTKGFGLNDPKYSNSTEEGRRLNRRAEIHF